MDLFAISSLMVFVTGIGSALFFYFNNKYSKVNRAWLYASIAIGVWGLSLYGVVVSPTKNIALVWQYLLDFSATFIPVLYLHFTFEFLKIEDRRILKLIDFAAALIAIFSFTPLFKVNMTTRFGYNWINPGPYYFVLPAFFTLLVFFSMYLLVKAFITNKNNPLIRSQALYVFIGGAIGFSGGITNFLPQLFNVYPFGNYFVILYVVFMSYSVIKHRLFNAKSIATELFAGAVTVVFLFNVLTYSSPRDLIIKAVEFLFAVFFNVFLIRSFSKELEQRDKIEKLAVELEQSNENLAEANERLKELDKKKTEFVSLASHQLRSPVTAIKGYSSMVLEGSFGPITDKVKDAMQRVFQSSQKLTTVIEDFLNVTRIELGRMKYDITDFDFNALVKNVIAEQKPNIESRKLTISYTEDKPEYKIYGDQGKISEVISNLIDNAAKYTNEGSLAVKIEGLKDEGDKDRVRFSIKDTGVGIGPETMPHLFAKFSRAEDVSTNIIGAGLGLYVAKQIIDAHPRAKIWAESAGKGKGSTFFVEFDVDTKFEIIQAAVPEPNLEMSPKSDTAVLDAIQ